MKSGCCPSRPRDLTDKAKRLTGGLKHFKLDRMDMPEKPTKKTVTITLKRIRTGIPKVVVASGFKLRPDKATGLIDVYFEITGLKVERVTLDPVLLRTNLNSFKQYSASLVAEQDDAAMREELPGADVTTAANVVHFSQMSGRAETIFGIFSFADWVEATRQSKPIELNSMDVLVVMSTVGVQKKFLLELVLAINSLTQQGKA